jgi:putative transposase
MDLCREHGISEAAFYNWKARYGGLDVSEPQCLRQMEDENRRLKTLVADLSLDKEPLNVVIRKRLELASLREDIAFVSAGFHLSAGSARCWVWIEPAIGTSRGRIGTRCCARSW